MERKEGIIQPLFGPPWNGGDGRWRIVPCGIFILLLWIVALRGLNELFAPGRWQTMALLIISLAIVPGIIARFIVPSARIIATSSGTIGSLLGFMFYLWVNGRVEPWLRDPIGQRDAIRDAIMNSAAPMEVLVPTSDMVLALVLLTVWLSLLLLVGTDSLFLSALVPTALALTSTIVTGLRIEALVTWGLLAAWVGVLWAASPESPPARIRGFVARLIDRIRTGTARLLAAICAIGVASFLVTIVPVGETHPWSATGVAPAPVGSTVPDVTVSLSNQIRRGAETTAFRYTGIPAGTSSRFTLASLADFESGTWKPIDTPNLLPLEREMDINAPNYSGVLESLPIRSDREQPAVEGSVAIEVQGLVSEWLPLLQGTWQLDPVGPGATVNLGPTQVTTTEQATTIEPEKWGWVPGTDTIRSPDGSTRRAMVYSVKGWASSEISGPNSVNLLALDRDDNGAALKRIIEVPNESIDATTSHGVDLSRYLTLPEGMPEEISAAAQEATANAATPLAKAKALEVYFTSGNFKYDESIPYTAGSNPADPYGVMTALLEQRSGFCVHYASTYAVMARELGIPTRLSVGYATRTDDSNEWVSVSGRDLHAWPEVHVDGIGWVPVEPTPGGAGWRANTGNREEPPATQDAQSADSQSAESEQSENAQSAADSAAEQSQSEEQGISSGSTSGSPGVGSDAARDGGIGAWFGRAWAAFMAVFPWLCGLALLVGVLCAPRLIRAQRSRQRRETVARGDMPASAAWDEVLDTAADLGWVSVDVAGWRSVRSGRGPVRAVAGTGGELRARTAEAIVEYLENTGALPVSEESTRAGHYLLHALDGEKWAPEGEAAWVASQDMAAPGGAVSAAVPSVSPDDLAMARDILLAGLWNSAAPGQRVRARWVPATVFARRTRSLRGKG